MLLRVFQERVYVSAMYLALQQHADELDKGVSLSSTTSCLSSFRISASDIAYFLLGKASFATLSDDGVFRLARATAADDHAWAAHYTNELFANDAFFSQLPALLRNGFAGQPLVEKLFNETTQVWRAPQANDRETSHAIVCHGLFCALLVAAAAELDLNASLPAASAQDVAHKLGLPAPVAATLLQHLESMGLVALAPGSVAFTADGTACFRVQRALCGLEYYARFGRHARRIMETSQSGPMLEFGMAFFDAHKKIERFHGTYGAFLLLLGGGLNARLCAALPERMQGFARIVDVGGGQGDFLAAFLKTHPHMHGTLFDLPETVQRAQDTNPAFAGGGERVSFVGGDFFDAATYPRAVAGGGATLYNLKFVLHDWSLADQVRILKGIRANMQPQDRVCVREILKRDRDVRCATYVWHTMVSYGEARVSTLEDYKSVAAQATLTLDTITPESEFFIQSLLFKAE